MKSIKWHDNVKDRGKGIKEPVVPEWWFNIQLLVSHQNMNIDKITKIDSAFNGLMAVVQEILED